MISKPLAPKDPQKKRKGFFVLLDQKIGGIPQDDNISKHPIYLDNGRLVTFAKMVGGVLDEKILDMITTADGFKKLVHSIGISAVCDDKEKNIDFTLIFYGKDGPYGGSSNHLTIKANGAENITELKDLEFSENDEKPGQFLFGLSDIKDTASITMKLYLNDGFDIDEVEPDPKIDFESTQYKDMIKRSFLSAGNNFRVKKIFDKLKNGEKTTIAFLGGSITQGAGAVPIQDNCYARKTYLALKDKYGDNLEYIKAGVGGTPSQLGIIRYERDITKDGTKHPDLVVIEFAVNDASDETKGIFYESLVRKVLNQPNKPAVILLFSVFADDWNLKDRLSPIGYRYQLPMVDVLDAVSPQFTKKHGEGLVLTKRQYFYDLYHPSNIGHQIMTDCLMYMFERLYIQQPLPDISNNIPPYYANYFENIHLLDKKYSLSSTTISEGSFTQTDKDLQSVPLDYEFDNTPQFPYNWQKKAGEDKPFELDIICKSLVLVFKDSADESFGKARVSIDSENEMIIDPREAGWTHCHAKILFNYDESKKHNIKIETLEKDKTFTILGFGYVL